MKEEDYSKYYIQGSDHYLIPKDIFDELYQEMDNWRNASQQLETNWKEMKRYIDENKLLLNNPQILDFYLKMQELESGNNE